MPLNNSETRSKLEVAEEQLTSLLFILRGTLKEKLKFASIYFNPLRIEELPLHQKLIYTTHFLVDGLVLERLKKIPGVGGLVEKFSEKLMDIVDGKDSECE
ncbi:hypothetical protein ACFL21_02140 [Patescibacteria group bacterium]